MKAYAVDRSLEGVKVLLVDGNEDLCLVHQSFLGVEGAVVDSVCDIQRGVEASRQKSYDVVILSAQTLEQDGESVQQLQNFRVGCPSMILLSSTRGGSVEKDMEFSEVLTLPVRKETIVTAVGRCTHLEASLGNETADLVQSLKRKFLERLPGILQEIEREHGEKNWEKLSRVCHKVRGSTEIFQLGLLSDELRELERMLQAQVDEIRVGEKVATVISEGNDLFESRR